MNIAFDGVALLGPMSKNRGIGNYALSQFRQILREDKENKYFFFNIFEETDVFTEEVAAGLLQEDDFLCMKAGRFLDLPGVAEMLGDLVKAYIEKNKIDVFYITSPFDNNVPLYKKEWFGDTVVVATVYDIIPYVMKHHYFPRKEDMKWYMERIDMLRWMDRFLVISQSVKDDLLEYLDFDEEKIDVIWGAAGPQFRQIEVTAAQRDKLYAKFRIDSPFIMCTGGDDERKNIAGLIEAFGKLPRNLTKAHQLVIVCKLSQQSVERYTQLAKQFGVEGRVILTNFVSDEELIQFYNLAELVAFPSVYEGFGLPVVEAWECGTPVLTSNNSSLVQLAGDAATVVDPHSIADITRGLKEALDEKKLQELTELGMERVKMFRWDNVARDSIRSFEMAFQDKKSGREVNKRIAFFTPLPPLQSGISDYSQDILWELSQYFNIDVFVDDKYTVDCDLPDNVSVFQHKKYTKRRPQYLDTVYQMGNSEYHVYMWPYLKQYGGTLVLHDYNMHGIAQAAALYFQKNNRQLYRELLLGDFSVAAVDSYLDEVDRGHGLKINEMELNGFVTNYVDKIIVHSQEALEKLLIRDAGRNVSLIRHYAHIKPLVDSSQAKRELGINEDTLLFAAFGHVHETKRAIPALRAFAKLAKHHDNVKLIFVGKLDANLKPKFENEVKNLGMENLVQVTGYTEIEEFKQYIDAADVCLNLRWPYNGETSGSLMRILAKGKCVVVNNIGSFGEIPDDACIKLPSVEKLSDEEEVEAIYNAMNILAGDDKIKEKLMKNARAFAEESLDIKKIAQQYAACISHRPSKAVTEELMSHLRNEIQNRGFTSEEIYRLAHTLAFAK